MHFLCAAHLAELREWLNDKGFVSSEISMADRERQAARNPITREFFPGRMTVDEFVQAVSNPKTVANFAANMKHLSPTMPEHRYVEEWAKTFVAWMEMS